MIICSEDEIITVTENMHKSKQYLLDYIALFHGNTSDEYHDAEFLIQSSKDISIWLNLFDGNCDEVNECNRRFRHWKIEQSAMSLEEFSDLLVLDSKDFVETVFQQPSNIRTLFELDTALGNDINVDTLFNLHVKQPYSRLEFLI